MDNSRIPKKVLDEKFRGRRPVGRRRLRWEENIRRDYSLLLSVRDGSVRGGELMERPRPDAGCSSTDDFIN